MTTTDQQHLCALLAREFAGIRRRLDLIDRRFDRIETRLLRVETSLRDHRSEFRAQARPTLHPDTGIGALRALQPSTSS